MNRKTLTDMKWVGPILSGGQTGPSPVVCHSCRLYAVIHSWFLKSVPFQDSNFTLRKKLSLKNP